MREIVSFYIGQPGVQIAFSHWEQLCSEHKIDLDGKLIEEKMGCYGSPQLMFSESHFNTFTPRAALFDGDSEITVQIKKNKLRNLFNKNFCKTDQLESGSIWPRGFNMLNESNQEIVRKLSEQCDSLAGFMIYHSIQGGYGGGFTSNLLNYLDEHTIKTQKTTISLFPSKPNHFCLDQSQVEPYNSILTLSKFPLTDFNIILQNRAISRNFTSHNQVQEFSFQNLNQIIAHLSSSLTYPLRVGGQNMIDFFDLKNKMSNNQRDQLYWASLSMNEFAFAQKQKQDIKLQNIFEKLFDNRGALLEYSLKQNCFFASTFFVRGQYQIEELKQIIKMIKHSNSINFANQDKKKIHLYQKQSLTSKQHISQQNELLVCKLSNSTAIQSPLQQLNQRFIKLYSKKSFLHWYLREGLEVANFLEAQEELFQYIESYKHPSGMKDNEEFEEFEEIFQFQPKATNAQNYSEQEQNNQLTSRSKIINKTPKQFRAEPYLKNQQLKKYVDNGGKNQNAFEKENRNFIDENFGKKNNIYSVRQLADEEEEITNIKQNLEEVKKANYSDEFQNMNDDQKILDQNQLEYLQNSQEQLNISKLVHIQKEKKQEQNISLSQSEQKQDQQKSSEEKQNENKATQEKEENPSFSNQISNGILKKANIYFQQNKDYLAQDIGQFVFEYCKLISKIGKVLYFALTDIRDKAQTIIDRGNEYKNEVEGIFKIIELEKSRNLLRLNGSNNKEIRKNNTLQNYQSLARTVLRIVWFFNFLTRICQDLLQNREKKTSDIFLEAYNQSLAQYHNYFIKNASKAACLAAPSREEIFQAFASQQSEEQAYTSIQDLINLLQPITNNIQKFYDENQLNDLP